MFSPCLCQRLFLAKDLKLSKRQVTGRNINLCIGRQNRVKKGKCQHKQEQAKHIKRTEMFSVFWVEFPTNEPRLWHLSQSMTVYL